MLPPAGKGAGAGRRGTVGECRGPCGDTSADRMRATFLGVRQQGWKYKLGNQVKPLLVVAPLRIPFFPAHWSALRGKLLLTAESAS